MLKASLRVVRNDALSVSECMALEPGRVVISPGPGEPSGAGICKELIQACVGRVPVLGVCLGHQCLAEVFDAKIVRAEVPMHGKLSRIRHFGCPLFQGLGKEFMVTRYHSLAVERASLPDALCVTAESQTGEIMAIRHRTEPLFGIQFHPEALLTEGGLHMLNNFLQQ